jgi:hypothetical protein
MDNINGQLARLKREIVMAACAARKEVHDQVFNIGADKPYSVNELADCLRPF